jgi:mannose-6-phosphate isomerase-like protein (cupin superfamily)
MELITQNEIPVLIKPGVESYQLISLLNSKSKNVTITKVKVQSGESQTLHKHDNSEQVWIALSGSAQLLLAEYSRTRFVEGDIVRFEIKESHGLLNDGDQVFEYLAVTSPPIDFEKAYTERVNK